MYLFPLIVIILIVPAGLLLIPIYLSIYLNIDGFSICGFFKVKWFGKILYKSDLHLPDDVGDKNAVDRGFKPDHAWFPKDARILIDATFAFFRVLKGLMGAIHVKHILCTVTFGLNDPADTAVVCGYLWALTSAVSLPGTSIRVDPYFEGERLAGSLNAEIRGRLLWIFVAFINALREKPIRRLLKELLRNEITSRKYHREKNNANAIEL